MAGTFNRVFILGRLGSDPECKQTEKGQLVCTFSVATEEVWRDKESQIQKRVTWVPVVVWGKQAETIAANLRKGSQVHLEGKIQERWWDDAKTGQRRSTLELVADRVTFLESGERSQREPREPRNPNEPRSKNPDATPLKPGQRPDEDDDGIPF